MIVLGVFVFFGLLILFAGCVMLQVCDSRMRMINADWLDEAEKFKLISRWGTQL